MPATAKFRLRQPDSLAVCRCSGPFPNRPGTCVVTDPLWPFSVHFDVDAGVYVGDTPEEADAAAHAAACDGAQIDIDHKIALLLAGAAAATINCRKKGGAGSMCGFREFMDISDPPKFYRTKTKSGTNTIRVFTDNIDCLGGVFGDIVTLWDLSCLYDQFTCGLTQTNLSTVTTYGSVGGASAGCNETILDPTSSTDSFTSFGDNSCIPNGGMVGPDYKAIKKSGNTAWRLQDEDTEGDAEARANAVIADWTNCADCGADSCVAKRTDRTGTGSGDFLYTTVEFKASWYAYRQCSYTVRIGFGRRVLGDVGPFASLGMDFVVTMTAPSTDGLIETGWVEVPNEGGFETKVISCVVTVIPFIP